MKSNKKRLTAHLYGIMSYSYLPAEMCFIGRDGMVDDCDGCSEYCEGIDNACDKCAIQKCFDLLGEYENTGLTPEEVREIDRMYSDLSKEVMQYRKIGTVAEVKSMGKYSRLAMKHGTIGRAIDACAEYEAIGTVEECQEAMGKQKAKKPVKDEHNHKCCPSCGWIVYKDEYEGRYLPHCENCGQAIDWSDGEESLPHAYNVERVIEQLERELSSCVDYHRKYGNCGNQICAYKKALKIVKSGGFEE